MKGKGKLINEITLMNLKFFLKIKYPKGYLLNYVVSNY